MYKNILRKQITMNGKDGVEISKNSKKADFKHIVSEDSMVVLRDHDLIVNEHKRHKDSKNGKVQLKKLWKPQGTTTVVYSAYQKSATAHNN
jgi:hypothetical protein